MQAELMSLGLIGGMGMSCCRFWVGHGCQSLRDTLPLASHHHVLSQFSHPFRRILLVTLHATPPSHQVIRSHCLERSSGARDTKVKIGKACAENAEMVYIATSARAWYSFLPAQLVIFSNIVIGSLPCQDALPGSYLVYAPLWLRLVVLPRANWSRNISERVCMMDEQQTLAMFPRVLSPLGETWRHVYIIELVQYDLLLPNDHGNLEQQSSSYNRPKWCFQCLFRFFWPGPLRWPPSLSLQLLLLTLSTPKVVMASPQSSAVPLAISLP